MNTQLSQNLPSGSRRLIAFGAMLATYMQGLNI